ncbi:MAG: hypothetical protein KAI53_01825 [Candidatus Aenigmarchaeota archaeon]|nr:hypothetical protein [Candidatus Aenigmarchaeota archaeon]
MSTQNVKVGDMFDLGFEKTEIGLQWDLELKQLTLSYGTTKNRSFEKLRKFEERHILKMPIDGLTAYKRVVDKLTEYDFNILTDLTYQKDPALINCDEVLEFLNDNTRYIIAEAEEGLRKTIIDGYKITGKMPCVEFEGLGVSDNTISMNQAHISVNNQKQEIATSSISQEGNISSKIKFENILFEKDNIPFYFDAEMVYVLNILNETKNSFPEISPATTNLYVELKESSTPQDVYNKFLSSEIKELELKEGINIFGVVDVLGNKKMINEPYRSTAPGGLLLQMTVESGEDIRELTKYMNETLKPIMDNYKLKYGFLEETPKKISVLDRASLNHIKQQISSDKKANA